MVLFVFIPSFSYIFCFKLMSIVKNKNLLDSGFENPSDVMGQFQRGIVFSLLEIDYCLPPHSHLQCEIARGQIESRSELFDTGFHNFHPIILSDPPGNDAISSIDRIYRAWPMSDRTPAVRDPYFHNRI